jgi:hypothetical protein
MAEKKASKKHKARGHSAIAQSYSNLDDGLNGGFPTNVVNTRDMSLSLYG